LYHVPASINKNLRRAIALAVVACSFGAGFLGRLLIDGRISGAVALNLAVYCGLLALCWLASVSQSRISLYALAGVGLALGLVCIAIRFGLLFHFTPRTAWRWKKLSVPVAALAAAPVYIWHFCRMASARTKFE
jgi:hypothetical protein